ncbi:MAG TPA: response regulator [Blastocatellia bacterium]|nr:response regulator [Blastocatellia bacterium]
MQNTEISILIVEDEPPIQTLLLDLLAPNYTCWSAESASNAIRLVESRFFHLALVDTGLPGMSGISLCRLIVNRSPQTMVIVVSGNSDPQSIDEARKAGATDYIIKPFTLAQVVETVERSLKRHCPKSVA